MAAASVNRRVWGWYFFDWASQPYNTLLLTFIFGPYINDLMGDGSAAQSAWGYGVGITGLLIAVGSPYLGAVADRAGGRMAFICLFSLMYVLGAWGLWYAAPGNYNLVLILVSFVFIATQIRLGFLCEMVIVCCLIFAHPGSVVDAWLSVANQRPYDPAFAPWKWRGWWDFGTGAFGDVACHIMDGAYWALDLGAPTAVEAG